MEFYSKRIVLRANSWLILAPASIFKCISYQLSVFGGTHKIAPDFCIISIYIHRYWENEIEAWKMNFDGMRFHRTIETAWER